MIRYLVTFAGFLVSVAGYGEDPRVGRSRGAPLPGTLSSVGGGGEESPPIYRPGSQAYVVSQFVKPKPPHQYWEEETSLTIIPENKNCLLCEAQDTGACRAMPSCVFCEPTVTALCERIIITILFIVP
nr:uncharacterized protein LOC110378056 [Helicoverpa armigera]